MAAKKEVALRKRQQIDSSKRTMFIVVAIVAFVSGIALVVIFFLAQQIFFHSRVIGTNQDTLKTIDSNVEAVNELKDNVRRLTTNQDLNSVKLKDDSSALQAILDALPAEANSDALGASLQNVFIGSVDGLSIESMIIGSEGEGVETETDSDEGEGSNTDSEGEAASPSVSFSFSVVGPAEKLQELLVRMERSIRVMQIDSIEIKTNDDGNITMDVMGRAYYEPGKVVELKKKVIKPNEKS